MNNPTLAPSSTGGSIDPQVVGSMQTLRTGLDLTRASQLTMLRLQLALHGSNRRAAMQALDNLLDIDAEMAGLTATLIGFPAHRTDDAALPGFIGLQRAAIAAEKHALTGGDWASDARAIANMAAEDRAGGANLPTPLLCPDDEVERDNRAGRRRWMPVVAVVIALLGCGLIAYLWPALPVALAPF